VREKKEMGCRENRERRGGIKIKIMIKKIREKNKKSE
jgi:hypothetical protein